MSCRACSSPDWGFDATHATPGLPTSVAGIAGAFSAGTVSAGLSAPKQTSNNLCHRRSSAIETWNLARSSRNSWTTSSPLGDTHVMSSSWCPSNTANENMPQSPCAGTSTGRKRNGDMRSHNRNQARRCSHMVSVSVCTRLALTAGGRSSNRWFRHILVDRAVPTALLWAATSSSTCAPLTPSGIGMAGTQWLNEAMSDKPTGS